MDLGQKAPNPTPDEVTVPNVEQVPRPIWEIDRRLKELLGSNVRVSAESFSTTRWDGDLTQLIPTRSLVLPDNSETTVLPVFFEGKLVDFQREIAVIYVRLEALSFPEKPAEGIVYFRGRTAVILKGPAIVQLASPYFVEKLPHDPDNYWRDLQEGNTQLKFCF